MKETHTSSISEGNDALRRDSSGKTDAASRPSGMYPVRVGSSSPLECIETRPRVLVGMPKDSACSEFVHSLHGSERMHIVEFDPSCADWSESLWPQEVDVAVLHANCLNLNCAPLVHDPRFGFPEHVFVVDDNSVSQRLALMSRGYRHVICAEHVAHWLHEQLASLCTLARARRIVLRACSAEAPRATLTLGPAAAGAKSLHSAETQFRETFLRALLTEHGSRRSAAEAAGVPYRSFCEMLRKLGI